MKKTWLMLGFVAVILVFVVMAGTAQLDDRTVISPTPTDPDAMRPMQPLAAIEHETALRTRLEESFGQMPLLFVENQGQWDQQVAYGVQGSDKTLYFTAKGVTFALASPTANEDEMTRIEHWPGSREARTDYRQPVRSQRWVVKLDFLGANHGARPVGKEQDEAVVSYFKGRPDEWRTGLPTYRRLVYHDLWPGIDLVYEGTVNQLKYHFVVRPGANPSQIRLAYRGASAIEVNAAGHLVLTTPLGGFQDDVPMAYQVADGARVPVDVSYALEAVDADGQPYHFDLGAYDPTLPLILDPAVLMYAGYIGGAAFDLANGVAVDGSGYAYVAGYTDSSESTFPVTVGPDLTHNGAFDAFVAKINPAGTELLYVGYIGGINNDYAQDISVDTGGNAFIVGYTDSNEATFPVTVGPDLTYNGGTVDAFVARVNSSGTQLDYAGYIGGAGYDNAHSIGVDAIGNVAVTGYTTSVESDFPVTVGPDLTFNGQGDAFVAKVNSTGAELIYAGYIGGSSVDGGNGITMDSAGNTYVTGHTSSSESTFPVAIGPDLVYNGLGDTFVAKVNPDGTALVYAGYIGGSNQDEGNDIAVDDSGSIYIAGHTYSVSDFPVLIGPDLSFNGESDAFVAKVNPSGMGLVYAGFIGGINGDRAARVAVDDSGNAYVVGSTHSAEATFPVTGGPDLTYNGSGDAFVAKVDSAGTGLTYAGYIGGSSSDGVRGVALDTAGNVYLAGFTRSDEVTFPATVGPDLSFNGAIDAFVAKLGEGPHTMSGRVTDTNNSGLPGVTILTNTGQDILTDSDGDYLISGLVTGTYSITPTLSGHVFSPPSYRDVLVEHNVSNADFTGGTVPAAFLAWPLSSDSGQSAGSLFVERTSAVFDHALPAWSQPNGVMRPYFGDSYQVAGDRFDCGPPNAECYDGHDGYDFGAQLGTAVLAAADGTVTGSGWGCEGWFILIDHSGGFSTYYSHLRETPTISGTVAAQQQIGNVGSSFDPTCGRYSGSRLHFELRFQETVLDPSGWLGGPQPDPWGGQSENLWLFPVPTPDQWEVDGQSGGTHVSGSTTISVPPGAYNGSASFTLVDVSVAGASDALRPIGQSFNLSAVSAGEAPISRNRYSPTTGLTLTLPITISINYSDTQIIGLDESSLNVYAWDETAETWDSLTTTLDTVSNTARATSDEFGLFALLAADPDTAGPLIGHPVYSSTVTSNQWLTITVPISDAITGNNGVANASLFYSYSAPYSDTMISGTGPGANGDGEWVFPLPPQGASREGATLKFSIHALDGDVTPATNVNDNDGSYFSITIVAPAQADFQANPTSGVAPLAVALSNLSTGDFDTCLWAFGDGLSSSECNDPSHEYTMTGTYTVTLTVSGLGGTDTMTRTDYISVHESVTADFFAHPTSGIVPLTVVFTNTTTGDFTDVLWSFGDGVISTLPSPTHTYTESSSFTVTLSVSGLGGTDTITRTDYITAHEPVAADFSAAPLTGTVPLTGTFVNQSIGDFDTCLWDFGDGGSSNECNDPSHEYSVAGTYTVALTVSGLGGTDTMTRTDYISVHEPAVAEFIAHPTDGIAPLTAEFTNLSSGDYDACAWEFGDGASSIDCTDPSHVYTTTGVFSVTLMVSGQGGTDTITRTGYITVYEPVAADFGANPTTGVVPLVVSFTNLSAGNYDTCLWEFGDGGTSNDCNTPTHIYDVVGTYTVTLTVSGAGGVDTETKTAYVFVEEHTSYLPIVVHEP